jgi:acetyl esterase/lipase
MESISSCHRQRVNSNEGATMSGVQQMNLIETWHRVSDDDRSAAAAMLDRTQQHFAEFKGNMREAYDAMTAQTPMADGVELESVDNADVKGWWVRPEHAQAGRAILFLHGGAFVLGSATGYRGFASQLAVRAGIDTFVLDYPLAPEHPFPAAYDAVIAALKWLAKSGFRDIALVGDSAGGGLALSAVRGRFFAVGRSRVDGAVVAQRRNSRPSPDAIHPRRWRSRLPWVRQSRGPARVAAV